MPSGLVQSASRMLASRYLLSQAYIYQSLDVRAFFSPRNTTCAPRRKVSSLSFSWKTISHTGFFPGFVDPVQRSVPYPQLESSAFIEVSVIHLFQKHVGHKEAMDSAGIFVFGFQV